MTILSLTFLRHLKVLNYFFIITIFCLPCIYWMSITYAGKKSLIILILYVIFILLPIMYLHLTYYFYSSGYEYRIDNHKLIKIDLNQQSETIYDINDFKEIKIFMNGNRIYDGAFQPLPFDNYYYYAILFTSKGDKVILTCLQSNNLEKTLEETFDESIILKERTFYPTINL